MAGECPRKASTSSLDPPMHVQWSSVTAEKRLRARRAPEPPEILLGVKERLVGYRYSPACEAAHSPARPAAPSV